MKKNTSARNFWIFKHVSLILTVAAIIGVIAEPADNADFTAEMIIFKIICILCTALFGTLAGRADQLLMKELRKSGRG